MAPRQARKSLPAVLQHSSQEESSQEETPEQGPDFVAKAKGMLETHRAKREKSQKSLETDHAKRVKDLNGKIDGLFEGRENRVIKSQQVLWDRLEALNKKRANIEHHILTSMKTMEHYTRDITEQLIMVLDSRIEDITRSDDGEEQE